MKTLLLLLGLAAAPALGQPAPAPTPAAAPDYANGASWLCLPGRQDPCGVPLPTTALNANGYGSNGQAVPAANPPIDCFYVYPTVSRDAALNSDMEAGIEERGVAAVQFARFAGLCRTYAPMYRSATLRALGVALSGQDPAPIFNTAYGDVLAAWRHYLRHYNGGRPFVLIGHSQGSIHLIRLLASQIEGRPEAARMLSALLIGYNVEVPEGRVSGGTFRTTPLCTRLGQTGCVVTYVSFRAAAPPPPGALFGRAATPGRTIACTNPAALGSDASVPLDSYWYSQSSTVMPMSITWSRAGPPPTPFLRTEGLVSAACVQRGPLGYLAVTVNADPADARTDDIPGDVRLAGIAAPGWGIHTVDVNLTLGNLLRVVEAQSAAWARSHRPRR
jgi:pimeloyl-ACP methyl ester carboxylesterase